MLSVQFYFLGIFIETEASSPYFVVVVFSSFSLFFFLFAFTKACLVMFPFLFSFSYRTPWRFEMTSTNYLDMYDEIWHAQLILIKLFGRYPWFFSCQNLSVGFFTLVFLGLVTAQLAFLWRLVAHKRQDSCFPHNICWQFLYATEWF